jgi:1-acyl-sn-glycerol-3-phosphate acyltransferase
VAEGRQILVFPEGTRRAPGAPPAYKPGAAARYLNLKVPCVPMALNSGMFWPRRKFLRYPGTIIVEFLPPIPPGLDRKRFASRLIDDIETATNRLVEEAKVTYKKRTR